MLGSETTNAPGDSDIFFWLRRGFANGTINNDIHVLGWKPRVFILGYVSCHNNICFDKQEVLEL